jgi:hypothetical protein
VSFTNVDVHRPLDSIICIMVFVPFSWSGILYPLHIERPLVSDILEGVKPPLENTGEKTILIRSWTFRNNN